MGRWVFAVRLHFTSFPVTTYKERRGIISIPSRVSAKFPNDGHEGDDISFQSAIYFASLRFRESLKPNPLFHDPYAGCFIASGNNSTTKDVMPYISPYHYCLATKFIDETLLTALGHSDGVRQVVLLTDGMDTRPYRLRWPFYTSIFKISPTEVFNFASQKTEGIGARISRNCMLFHVPSESTYLLGALQRKGFDGNKPSIWAIQGLPLPSLASFEDILLVVSSLAMKGCLFFGELPLKLAETESDHLKDNIQRWAGRLFMGNGFRMNMVSYAQVALDFHRDPPRGKCSNILFVAEQIRLSDCQMDSWRRELQRAEDEGDEEGFEDM